MHLVGFTVEITYGVLEINNGGYNYKHVVTIDNVVKGKAIPLQAWTGPEGSRRVRLPDFKTIGTRKWKGCQPYVPAAFTPRKYSWYLILLEAESTPGS